VTDDVSPYTGLIAAQHQDKPNFMASVVASLQPLADMIATLNAMPAAFDVDQAVGAQLDAVGRWVGVSRDLQTPITGVYFAWDTAGVGWDQGSWFGPGDSTTGITALPDDSYRTLVRAKISANYWDGTIPAAYAVWALLLPSGTSIQIVDNGNWTMSLTLTGNPLNAVSQAMFNRGMLDLKPAGVSISSRTG
jgi:hypothetical protein